MITLGMQSYLMLCVFFDYVESDEPYKIPNLIRGIHRQLNGGAAVVAVQKNPEAKEAFGGAQVFAKASAGFTLEKSTMTFKKAKTWGDGIKFSPEGYSAKYKIRGGINVCRIGSWEAP